MTTPTEAGGKPVPLRISIAAQLDPVWRTGRIGQPVHADVQAYAEQMTGYIAENLERFGEHRGADVYVAVSVQRGGETSAHEYRSGHYVKEQASGAASRLPDGTWSCVKDGVTEPCGECGGCRSVQAENRVRPETADMQITVMSGQESGLQRLQRQAQATGDTVTEYAQLDKNGVFLVWDVNADTESRSPLAKRIRVARKFGGIIFRRRVIVAENWEEVTEQ